MSDLFIYEVDVINLNIMPTKSIEIDNAFTCITNDRICMLSGLSKLALIIYAYSECRSTWLIMLI